MNVHEQNEKLRGKLRELAQSSLSMHHDDSGIGDFLEALGPVEPAVPTGLALTIPWTGESFYAVYRASTEKPHKQDEWTALVPWRAAHMQRVAEALNIIHSQAPHESGEHAAPGSGEQAISQAIGPSALEKRPAAAGPGGTYEQVGIRWPQSAYRSKFYFAGMGDTVTREALSIAEPVYAFVPHQVGLRTPDSLSKG